jgi:hypothetical protein
MNFTTRDGVEVQKVPECYPLPASAKKIAQTVLAILNQGGVGVCDISLYGPHKCIRVIRQVPAAEKVHKDWDIFAQLGKAEIEEIETFGSPLMRTAQLFRVLESAGYKVNLLIAGTLDKLAEFSDVANSPTVFGATVVVDDTIDEDDIILCGSDLEDTEWRIRKVLRSSLGELKK